MFRRTTGARLYSFHRNTRAFAWHFNFSQLDLSKMRSGAVFPYAMADDAFSIDSPPRPLGFLTLKEEDKVFDLVESLNETLASHTYQEVMAKLADSPFNALHAQLSAEKFPDDDQNQDTDASIGIKPITSADIPSVQDLEIGASKAFQCIADFHSNACKQLLSSDSKIFKFSDKQYRPILYPEIAAGLDQQIEHYQQVGFVPITKVSNVRAVLQSCSMLPGRIHINAPHMLEMIGIENFEMGLRDHIEKVMSGDLQIAANRDALPEFMRNVYARPSVFRVQASCIITFDETTDWYDIARPLSSSDSDDSHVAAKLMKPHELMKLGIRVFDQPHTRHLYLSLVAPVQSPLAFRVYNINKAFWTR